MEKIKYIIIFTLLLALGLIYVQLDNYKSITTNLLHQNNTVIEKTKVDKKDINTLENNITNYQNQIEFYKNETKILKEKITQLKNKIILLEENTNTINDCINDINYTIPISTYEYHNKKIPNLYDTNKTTSNEHYDLSPSINLEEKKVDGFEIKYQQKF